MDSAPPPPPHNHTHSKPSSSSYPGGLPPGNYDIFIVPPHSSGSGFLYLPSFQSNRNSFLTGCAVTQAANWIWSATVPLIRQWCRGIFAGGGVAVVWLLLFVGVAAWAFGKTQAEKEKAGGGGSGSGDNMKSGAAEPPPEQNTNANGFSPRPAAGASTPGGAKPSWGNTTPAGAAGWEKAREEMRKREEERRKKDEAEKKAKEAAEKERWERARAREKEAREKETREKAEKEAKEKEAREKESRERGVREKEARKTAEREAEEAADTPKVEVKTGAYTAAFANGSRVSQSPSKTRTKSESETHYHKPTAASQADTEENSTSFRPYDTPTKPKRKPAPSTTTTSSSSIYSEPSSYVSGSTSRTSPPASQSGYERDRDGPYSTKDPDKIVIKGVYAYADAFSKPTSQLVSGEGKVTDGLVLKLTSEGVFVDDDVRGVAQREWDIKAWTLKSIESSDHTTHPLHILRTTTRSTENKAHVFIIPASEAWKVAVGLQKLRRGTQVRSLGVQGFAKGEAERLCDQLGWA